MKNIFLSEAEKQAEALVHLRRRLHRSAGVGFDLKDTLTIVEEELKKLGIQPVPCGKAGIVATIGGKKPGKTILLRADMDALPICEETGAEYACPTGNMHACGHDLHTAMLLGAARLLKEQEDTLCGTVKLMFQPAEEILEGAKDMLENGLLNAPVPDAAVMLHVMCGIAFPAGTAVVSGAGVSAPAADFFEIRIKGKGCHGSSPNLGIDPLTAAAHTVLALQELHARELAMDDRAALTIGSFHAGKAANAIPDTAILTGTLRAFSDDLRGRIKQRLQDIVYHTCAAYRAESEVLFTSGCPTLLNDADLSKAVTGYMKDLLGCDRAFSVPELMERTGSTGSKTAGSEDFSYVSHAVPSVMLSLAAGEPQKGYTHPLHHPQTAFDESVLPAGAAVYAYIARQWLSEHIAQP